MSEAGSSAGSTLLSAVTGDSTPVPVSSEPSGRGEITCDRLVNIVRGYAPNADLESIRRAFDVAKKAHESQLRDNGDPYITHPLAVAMILAGFRLDVPSILTALLHDTIEDTGITQEDLRAQFGPTVADLVDGVTKLTRLELQSDRTKQAENFRKLVLAMSKDIRVLLVKLADRLHNMRTLHFVERVDRRQRIARETLDIYAPLAERIGMDRVKTELQNLSFAQLEPEADATIRARLNYLRGQGADVIEEVRRELLRLCEEAGLKNVHVSGREKSPYSIWEKMQRRNVAFEQLSDIMAFRVVVDTREDCYMALGAVHAAYPVIAGRFKDYISTPKANGYQSLHTGVTLRSPRNQKIEVQIRTEAMHDIAENGVAAHWAYKEGDAESEGGGIAGFRRPRWVQDLLEILEASSAPDEFLENTKLELYQDQVFCFSPKGQLISLPRGATSVDFAYAVHSQIGDSCVGAKINGRLMPLRHELQNGDQVEIMTARGGAPSPSWERFVVTGKARARIRRYVAAQQRQTYLDSGRAALAKAFRQEGVDGSEKVIETTLKALKQNSLQDLYVSVGNNNLGARDVVHAAYPELRRAPRVPRMVAGLPGVLGTAGPRPRATSGASSGRSGGAIPLVGLGPGVAVHFAACCHALPGDRIVGVVATGKGVTIHTRTCPTLESFAATPERFLDVDWDYDAMSRSGSGELRVGRITIVAENESAVLAAITNTVSKADASVVNLKIVHRQLDFMEILVDVEVRDLRHLSSVIAALRAAQGISQADRARA